MENPLKLVDVHASTGKAKPYRKIKTFRIPPTLNEATTRKRKRDKDKAATTCAMPILTYLVKFCKSHNVAM